METIGLCKECTAIITKEHECLPDYPGVFECPFCSYPNTRLNLWYETKEQEMKSMVEFQEELINRTLKNF